MCGMYQHPQYPRSDLEDKRPPKRTEEPCLSLMTCIDFVLFLSSFLSLCTSGYTGTQQITLASNSELHLSLSPTPSVPPLPVPGLKACATLERDPEAVGPPEE